jgi:hypothetical protein
MNECERWVQRNWAGDLLERERWQIENKKILLNIKNEIRTKA